MASNLKKTIGTMKCWNPACRCDIPIKQADTGTLDLSCKMCDLSSYAKPGTQAHADAMALIQPMARNTTPGEGGKPAAPAPKPAPAAKGPPPAAPAPTTPPKARASVFHLGG